MVLIYKDSTEYSQVNNVILIGELFCDEEREKMTRDMLYQPPHILTQRMKVSQGGWELGGLDVEGGKKKSLYNNGMVKKDDLVFERAS